MIALIPQLESTLAYLQPEARPSAESFDDVLKAAADSTPPPQPAAPPQYVVQRGDNLSEIAKKLGYSDPMELARTNGIKNPDLIQVGQVLNLPAKDSGTQGTTMLAATGKAHQSAKTAAANVQIKRINARAGKLVVASWYGANHAGKPMANGRPFDMYADTVAHKTLPLGTKVTLTNPANGRIATAEVTDRGPYIWGRNLDVSYGVARKLGMVEQGVAKLRMQKG
ncbi:MAG: septal ring lytic transglycosylase RlpA family protein [Syntrophales bacterium]|nr:septal ring lytic transglycosylase RlpA family protein [Syntrophales bacterium]